MTADRRGNAANPSTTRRIFADGEWRDAPVYARRDLRPGSAVAGPALIIEAHQTIVVEPGWQAEITAKNHVADAPRREEARAALRSAPKPTR